MNRWNDGVLEVVDSAIRQAAAGTPTTLVVIGSAGMGKSTLLHEIAHRAKGFIHITAEAYESTAALPYGILTQLGVETGNAGDLPQPVIAAQRLRGLADEAAATAPVLVQIDDLQWADPESVESLIALLGRARGDRLLLCVGSRPLAPGEQETWRRWAARPGRVRAVQLDGLDEPDASALVEELRPGTARSVARRLWEHTGGNPLYLRNLLAEYDATELDHMRVLPAPAEFAETVTARLARLAGDGRDVGYAVAVLGDRWSSVVEVAAVADVRDPAADVDQLLDTNLLQLRPSDTGDRVRLTHSLVRAAIYQQIPLARRRALHLRAASIVVSAAEVLEHRLASVASYDDQLAADLEAHANGLHAQRSYRLAAHYLAAASAVSGDPVDRERRWLESLYEQILGGDRDNARRAHDDIARAQDVRRRELVLGTLALWERRPREAIAILTPWSGQAEPEPASAVQHRIEAVLAWAGVNAGAPEADITLALQRAAAQPVHDPAVARLADLAGAQLAARHAGHPDSLPNDASLPEHPGAVAPEATALLAWRGLVRANIGQFPQAAADLSELTDRMQRGLHEFSSGTFHAVLARAQWFAGDWAAARINLRVAMELSAEYPHPIVVASAPLLAIGEGDDQTAEALLASARELLVQSPWPEAVDQLTITQIIRQHAAATPSARPYISLRSSFRDLRDGRVHKTVLWHTHAALSAIWARELADARLCADHVASAADRAPWASWVSSWLRGLIAEAAGDGKGALAQLRKASASDLATMPLYAAHLQLDHARLAHLLGDVAAAGQALDAAATTYRSLNAVPYVQRVEQIRRSSEAAVQSVSVMLSDRERDVLTLLATGMSYAQIARDLFITQSTVSYHLGNIYAKANVSSRHQLTQLVRQDPTVFGLPSAV